MLVFMSRKCHVDGVVILLARFFRVIVITIFCIREVKNSELLMRFRGHASYAAWKYVHKAVHVTICCNCLSINRPF